jgi:hypothetical protein
MFEQEILIVNICELGLSLKADSYDSVVTDATVPMNTISITLTTVSLFRMRSMICSSSNVTKIPILQLHPSRVLTILQQTLSPYIPFPTLQPL